MGIADRLRHLRSKAEQEGAEHKDQIREAVGKAEAAADQQTGGKYHDQIAKAGAKVEDYVENLKPQDAERPGGGQAPRGSEAREAR